MISAYKYKGNTASRFFYLKLLPQRQVNAVWSTTVKNCSLFPQKSSWSIWLREFTSTSDTDVSQNGKLVENSLHGLTN